MMENMENALPAGKMQRICRRISKIFQQTCALFWKNILRVWRMKMETFQEWITTLVLIFTIYLTTRVIYHSPRQEIPYESLGRLDDPAFNATGVKVIYTPVTNATRQIMDKVASDSAMMGIKPKGVKDEKIIEKDAFRHGDFIGVVFKDASSYSLRFHSYSIVYPSDVLDQIEACQNYSSSYCNVPSYWKEGFLSLQASIDAIIIEAKTNHSVWEEMKSISGIYLKSDLNKPVYRMGYIWFIFGLIVCFTPNMYFLSMKVIREKKKLKVLMKAMGLHDIAFWLSWSLLYTIYVSIPASLLTAITFEVLYEGNFTEIFFFYFFYGIATIHFYFMLSSLLKQPNITGFVGFALQVVFGCLGFLTFFEMLPPAFEWSFSLMSSFVCAAGISKIIILERYGAMLTPEFYPFLNLYIILIFDSVLYMLLAIYFDKVLPGKYGVQYPPLFFLKPSYWFQHKSRSTGEGTGNGSSHGALGTAEEPMPPEFAGKEAIRINNITKTYKRKDKTTEALKDLSLNVYEGQITALLGHSGSGKTTLLNVLSGFAQPSAGKMMDPYAEDEKLSGFQVNQDEEIKLKSHVILQVIRSAQMVPFTNALRLIRPSWICSSSATIYNYKVAEIENTEGIQATVGICPQSNLHFETLTVKENLRTFAHIKGIQMKEVEQEVKKVLTALDLTDLQNVLPNTLTVGQKRKLSLGIAILGNPKVLLLDEPTVGLDPSSRHHVWRLLKENQAGRVTLFTTQCMGEADIHADRKAFLSNGRLQCVGSSLYLKRKWGVGYHLRMHVNDLCDPEVASALVRQYIPDAVFRGQRGDELCYMLPMENTDALPDLFSHLESNFLQGIVNYEVSRTTLEDVFLKLEGEEALDQEDGGVSGNEQLEDGECFDTEEMDRSLLTLWETGRATVSGVELWRQQVRAIARVRFLKLKHDGKLLRSILLFLGVFILPLFIIFIGFQLTEGFSNFELTASLYFVPNEEKTHVKSTNLLIFNDTGSDIENFIHALKIQKIVPEIAVEQNITSMPQHNGAIKISLEGKRYQYTIMCSAEPINCFPVLMNILSNTFLRLFNSTEHIRVWNDPFPHMKNPAFMHEIFYRCFAFMLLLVAGLPSHFAMSSMDDYKIRARSQLRLAGLFPSAYWCGQALVDVPLYWALISLMAGILVLFCYSSFFNATTILALIVCIIGYGISLVLHIYLIAFKFRNGRSNRYFWSFIIILISFIFYTFSSRHDIVCIIFSALTPWFPLLGWLIFAPEPYYFYMDEHSELQSKAFVPVFAPYFHCVIFVLLLCCLEIRYGEAATRRDPIFRFCRRRAVARHNRDHPGEEAAEVQAERERVRSAVASLPQQEDPVIVSSVRKEYEDTKASSFLKKKKKVAVKNLSFTIKKGEVLGLLGPNGAGKSTTLNMISGDITLTAGEVLVQGSDPSSPGQHSAGFFGYCPQENPLWPNLTVQEHLEVYAAVKGMRSEDVAANISRVAEALELQKHLKTEVRRLSMGEARKVSFALSMLGDPTVLLWDEPSVGMDPKEQQRMRKAIEMALKSKERGAVLSTHHLDEAVATCDRVAVLVSGQLRYIGSVEDLKRKFGQSYSLEVRMRDAGHRDAVHAEVLRLFPAAAQQESTSSSLLVYKIPMENVLPLSQSFSKLEAAKQNRRFEEYSLSLRTLQQVFVDLTTDSEEHDQDAASSEAQDQRPLHPRYI